MVSVAGVRVVEFGSKCVLQAVITIAIRLGVVSGSPSGGLTVRVVWPGLRVGGRFAPCHIHHMNRVNSRSGFSYDDSTINIVVIIMIITIRLRHDYDVFARARFHSTRFDASKKINVSIFRRSRVVVVS